MLAMVGHSGHGFIGIILGHFGQVDISLCLDCFLERICSCMFAKMFFSGDPVGTRKNIPFSKYSKHTRTNLF